MNLKLMTSKDNFNRSRGVVKRECNNFLIMINFDDGRYAEIDFQDNNIEIHNGKTWEKTIIYKDGETHKDINNRRKLMEVSNERD